MSSFQNQNKFKHQGRKFKNTKKNYEKEYVEELNRIIWFKPSYKIKYGGSNLNNLEKKTYKIWNIYNNGTEDNYKRLIETTRRYLFCLSKKKRKILEKKLKTIFDKTVDKIDDLQIYNKLREHFQKTISAEELIKAQKNHLKGDRGKNRTRQVLKFLDKDIEIDSYLDFGCNKGDITVAIGEHFNLKPENIHGCDIFEPSERKEGFQFTKINKNGELDYEDDKFSIISCFMVLHHIHPKQLDQCLDELYRVLKPDGYLIIREHDLSLSFSNKKNKKRKQLIEFRNILDIMHEFYKYVWCHEDFHLAMTDQNYKLNYLSSKEWDKKLFKRGFIEVDAYQDHSEDDECSVKKILKKNPNTYFHPIKNPYNVYFKVYKKMGFDSLFS